MQVARDVGLLKQRPKKGNDGKVNFVSQRRVQKMPEHRSDTDDLWSHLKVTLEGELSLWSQDQSQRTVRKANVNHVEQRWPSEGTKLDDNHVREETILDHI